VRRFRRAGAITLGLLAAIYFGDYLSARYGIPHHRPTLGSVQVQTMYAVRQKNNRIEYSLGDTVTETCVWSLFPQMGYTPCWYLSRHATRNIYIGWRGVERLLREAYWIVTETPVGLVMPPTEAVTGWSPLGKPAGKVTLN